VISEYHTHATMSLTSNWYDMMATEDDALLDLSLEDWTALRVTLMKTRPAFTTRIDHLRRALWYARKDRRTVTPEMPQMRYYRDIADEPWKYGDDAFEQWQLLDNDLPKFPGRWRVEAYWTMRLEEEVLAPQRLRFFALLQQAQAEFEAKVKVAKNLQALFRKRQLHQTIAKLQAVVRGHQQRCRINWMDCAECLAHGPTAYEVEGRCVCQTCYDSMGWCECAHCGMPVHRDRLADFSGCCSSECLAEIIGVEEDPEPAFCEGCGCPMDPEDHNDYRRGFWCSRACAYA
jgi:hypothetical protein